MRPLSLALCLALVTGALFDACAKVECSRNSDCGDRTRCEMNRCVRDCAEDRDCLDGERCNLNGLCVGRTPSDDVPPAVDDTGPADTGIVLPPVDTGVVVPVDTGPADTGVVLPPTDTGPADTGIVAPTDTGFDAGPPPPRDAGFDAGFDTGFDTGPRDTGIVLPTDVGFDTGPRDAGNPTGPVGVGVYEFTAVRPGDMLGPVAAAWHPGGQYALIVTSANHVYRYDRATDAITRVGSGGADVFWRSLAFTRDGARALLVGTSGTSTARRGRLFLWDHIASSLTERTGDSVVSGSFEAVRFAPDGSRAALLVQGSASTLIYFLAPDGSRVGSPVGRGMSSGTGCSDVAWITDGFGDPALILVCGQSTGEIAEVVNLNGTPRINTVVTSGLVGNTHRVTARRQGDLALAVGSSSNKLYRYFNGQWETGFERPFLRGAFGVTFNTEGTRALAFGGFGYLHEFRTNLYSAPEITQTQMPLAVAPFSQPTNATIADVAWRPGCDEGLIVGGSSNISRTTVFAATFRVANGRACSPQQQ